MLTPQSAVSATIALLSLSVRAEWTWDMWIERYKTRDCSDDKISDETNVVGPDCFPFEDNEPFAGFVPLVSKTVLRSSTRDLSVLIITSSGQNIKPLKWTGGNMETVASCFGLKASAKAPS